MSKYKIEKPEGAPEWFTPGIVCHVRDSEDASWSKPRTVIWFDVSEEFPFLDDEGSEWKDAKPVERWVPEDGEMVFIVWDTCDSSVIPTLSTFHGTLGYRHYYRFTDEVAEAIKAGILTVGWLREHGEKYAP